MQHWGQREVQVRLAAPVVHGPRRLAGRVVGVAQSRQVQELHWAQLVLLPHRRGRLTQQAGWRRQGWAQLCRGQARPQWRPPAAACCALTGGPTAAHPPLPLPLLVLVLVL